MENKNISLDILTERPVVRNDEGSELDVVIEISSKQTSEDKTRSQNALNLCLVVDRSGSMQGEKLETAKKSCIDIYKRLKEDDFLTVVVFDDEAQSIVNPQTPETEVIRKIETIRSGGQTNLSLGWYLGLLELQTYKTENHINRLILLSDGQANKGETKKSVLAKESLKARDLGITTSTIGIGNDFAEEILEALASESGGRFWYIQESKIEDIINEEFKGSLSVVVERPRIKLELPKGVQIVKQLNDVGRIADKYRIRPITSNYLFNFAIRLEFSPTLINSDMATLKAVLYDGENIINETEKPILLRSFEEYVVSEEHPIVKSIVQQYESSKSDEIMMEMIDKGDFDFMKMMIIEEMDGMHAVKDKLEVEREQEEFLREIDIVEEMLREDENMLIFADLIELIKRLVGDRIYETRVSDFLMRWRKMLMHRFHNKKDRHYGHKLDKDLQVRFLQEALLIADDIIREFPQEKDLLELRKKIYEQLEGYN